MSLSTRWEYNTALLTWSNEINEFESNMPGDNGQAGWELIDVVPEVYTPASINEFKNYSESTKTTESTEGAQSLPVGLKVIAQSAYFKKALDT